MAAVAAVVEVAALDILAVPTAILGATGVTPLPKPAEAQATPDSRVPVVVVETPALRVAPVLRETVLVYHPLVVFFPEVMRVMRVMVAPAVIQVLEVMRVMGVTYLLSRTRSLATGTEGGGLYLVIAVMGGLRAEAKAVPEVAVVVEGEERV